MINIIKEIDFSLNEKLERNIKKLLITNKNYEFGFVVNDNISSVIMTELIKKKISSITNIFISTANARMKKDKYYSIHISNNGIYGNMIYIHVCEHPSIVGIWNSKKDSLFTVENIIELGIKETKEKSVC